MCEHGSSSRSFVQDVSDTRVLADLLHCMHVSKLNKPFPHSQFLLVFYIRRTLNENVEMRNLRDPYVTLAVTADILAS